MSYKIFATEDFDKNVKRLSKKYHSFKNDLKVLRNELLKNPLSGSSLGKDCYKIRFAIKSKSKGKSGGARLITLVKVVNEKIYLLSVYDKSDKDTISDKEIEKLIEHIDK